MPLAHILDVTAGTVEGLVCGERFQDVPWRPRYGKKEDHMDDLKRGPGGLYGGV